MQLPLTVKIGPDTWKVRKLPTKKADIEKAEGIRDYKTHTLWIRTANRSPQFIVDTFMHEVTHAWWGVMGFSCAAEEEQLATRLPPVMLSFFKDNPELYSNIMEALEG